MSNLFAELQQASMIQSNTVRDARKKMNKLLECFLEEEERYELCDIFARDVRQLKTETFLDVDSFMIQPNRDFSNIKDHELMNDTYGLFKGGFCKFSGRYIYPVKDVQGDVMGWCGYDKFSEVKYLDSRNYGYVPKLNTLYGMEKLPEYYKSGKQVFFTEGIVCTLYLREIGEQSMALLGSNITPYVAEIINRFGTKARIIPDSDDAGNHLKAIAKRRCPKARILQSKIAKDVDDSRMVAPELCEEMSKFENPFYRSKYFT